MREAVISTVVITDVLPLASVNILNEGGPEEQAPEEVAVVGRAVVKASGYTDYQEQKEKINTIFRKYRKIPIGVPSTFDYGDLKNLLSPSNNSAAPRDDDEDPYDLKVISLSDVGNGLKSPVKASEQINFTLGVYGHFDISRGSADAGIAVCAYVSAETAAVFSKSALDSSLAGKQIKIWEKTVNINGGFQIPVKIYADAKIATIYFAGFTGLYGAGFDMHIDYGIRINWIKCLFFSIPVPVPYTNGNLSGITINETAYYAGVKMSPSLKSGKS